MSEKGSDVAFKLEGKILPAHKDILIQKSQYFAGLFNSGMIESRQNVIEIPDCEYQVFQEFLRYLYCEELKLDIDVAQKLYLFAEKHLKDDLKDKCFDFLRENIDSENVYKILDFACEQELSQLQSWCLNFFLTKIDMEDVSELIKYLDQQSKLEFANENIHLKNRLLDVLFIENYIKTCHETKQDTKPYEDFILKNIEMNSIQRIAKFLSSNQSSKQVITDENSSPSEIENDKILFDKMTVKLKSAVFGFLYENFEELKDKEIMKNLPVDFLVNYAQHVTHKLKESKNGRILESEQEKGENSQILEDGINGENKKKNNQTENNTKRGIKRKEPIHDKNLEENQTFKQTKKSPSS